MKVYDIKEGL